MHITGSSKSSDFFFCKTLPRRRRRYTTLAPRIPLAPCRACNPCHITVYLVSSSFSQTCGGRFCRGHCCCVNIYAAAAAASN